MSEWQAFSFRHERIVWQGWQSRLKNPLVAAWAIASERQNFLEQFICKFLLLFKKWKMTGIVKPDEFLMGSLDGLAVLPNQGRRAVRIVPPLKEQDWCPEVRPRVW
jgi:hypothetical protein